MENGHPVGCMRVWGVQKLFYAIHSLCRLADRTVHSPLCSRYEHVVINQRCNDVYSAGLLLLPPLPMLCAADWTLTWQISFMGSAGWILASIPVGYTMAQLIGMCTRSICAKIQYMRLWALLSSELGLLF